jgi:hypothetical protein
MSPGGGDGLAGEEEKGRLLFCKKEAKNFYLLRLAADLTALIQLLANRYPAPPSSAAPV